MKFVPAFLLVLLAIGLFVASIVSGAAVLIAIGLVVLVISERLFRRANRT